MAEISYASAPVPVRADLLAAHQRAWRRLARADNWWTGAERVAIAAEVRQARHCTRCVRNAKLRFPLTRSQGRTIGRAAK